MKSILVAFLMSGVVLLLGSSCATVPTKPLAPDELRLLSLQLPGAGRIKAGAFQTVFVHYESAGQPMIERTCFAWSGQEPRCSKARDLNLGLAGSFPMEIAGSHIGPQRLEIYVEYYRERRLRRTNVLSSIVEVIK